MNSTDDSSAFDRSRTAISRNNFSTPVQHLLERLVLRKRRSFFDYGCGKGDDLAGLQELGFDADGWDPNFRPGRPLKHAQVVNLGFVLNVIEDEKEREEVLRKAWNLTDGALMVSVISVYDRPSGKLKQFEDGFVTNTGTFQKYYEPGELNEYINEAIRIDSLPVTPWQIICFKDNEYEQEYLATSSNRALFRKAYPTPTHPLRKSRISQCIEQFRAESPADWDGIETICVNYAMAPPEQMISVHEPLRRCGITAKDVLEIVIEMYAFYKWEAIVSETKNKFIVQLALAFFRGKPQARHYGKNEKLAMRVHFGSFPAALEQAEMTLFSIGDVDRITALCAETTMGVEDEQALYVHSSCVPYLNPVLQTYIGAGQLFYGELDDVDIYKVHKQSGKLTLLFYEDFESVAEPILDTRAKINFRMRKIDFFDHRSDQQRLVGKNRYMAAIPT
jgi:DNA phosphorothioation-associated putative methyltransferase